MGKVGKLIQRLAIWGKTVSRAVSWRSSSGPSAGTPGLISYSRVVDLSHVIDRDIPLWPGDPPVEVETVAELSKKGFYLRRFSMGEHSGTHLNAPSSFHQGGDGIDAYPAESLVVSAVVIDIREKASANPDYTLSKEDIIKWESRYGRLRAGSVVLLYTGWAEKWPDPVAYLNRDASGGLHFPGFGNDAAGFLLTERGVGGVGTDAPGVDPGQDETFATNVQVLEQRRIALESLANLGQLPHTGATLVIGILRMRNGSGSPAAVTALVP